MICPRCNSIISNEKSKFCSKCGYDLSSQPEAVPAPKPVSAPAPAQKPVPTPAPTPIPAPTPTSKTVYGAVNDSGEVYSVLPGIPDQILWHYFGGRDEKYAEVFKKFAVNGKSSSFSLVALLFAPLWLLYRKLYFHFVISVCVLCFIPFASPILYGFWGRKFYYNKLVKSYDKLGRDMLSKKYGTNGVLVAIIAVIAVIYIIACS